MKKFLLLILLVFGVALAQAADSAPANSWFDKLWYDPIATFTGVLAVATIGLIVVSVIQWVQMKRAVDSSERSVRILERAYVAAGPGGRLLPPGDEKLPANEQRHIGITVSAVNYGRTPAYLKRVYWKLCTESE